MDDKVGNERLWKLEYCEGAGSEVSNLGKAAGVQARLDPAMSLCNLVQAVGRSLKVRRWEDVGVGIKALGVECAQGSHDHELGS